MKYKVAESPLHPEHHAASFLAFASSTERSQLVRERNIASIMKTLPKVKINQDTQNVTRPRNQSRLTMLEQWPRQSRDLLAPSLARIPLQSLWALLRRSSRTAEPSHQSLASLSLLECRCNWLLTRQKA